jgi:hypothetical protein
MFLYVFYLFLLFVISAFVLTGLPLAGTLLNYYRNRGRHAVKCPDADVVGDVVVDNKFALKTAMGGQSQTRVASCSRWPEAGECGQECLAQIEASPENVERLLSRWYAGKSCAICTRTLTATDWRESRVAVLDRNQKLLELRQIGLENLQKGLENTRPLCWKCHRAERERQASPTGELATA